MSSTQRPILYSALASQWANVPKLGLAEKGLTKEDIEVKEIGLLEAENFHPDYLKINPNATVPSLIIPDKSAPLIDSRDILRYLDEMKDPILTPTDPKMKARMEMIIDLVHSNDVNTNLILLQARDLEEYEDKRTGPFGAFVATRQQVLEKHHGAYPEHSFYGPKSKENGMLHSIYTTGPSSDRDAFFTATNTSYLKFADGMIKLENLLVLPFAAGDQITLADLHAAPWLSHALWGLGTKDVKDLSMLEAHLQKSAPGFRIGPKTQQWWNNYTDRAAFKEVFPVLH